MTTETLSIILAILTTIGGILAWVAKIQWSKEYKEAKEAEISSLRARIETLNMLSAEKFLPQYKSMKELLEKIIEDSRSQLAYAKERVEDQSSEIKKLSVHRENNIASIDLLKSQKNELQARVMRLDKLLKSYDKMDKYKLPDRLTLRDNSLSVSETLFADLDIFGKLIPDLPKGKEGKS